MSGDAGRVVCLGETMAQVVPSDGHRVHDAVDFAIGPAGAESNLAITLARLGTPSAWASWVGDDPLGSRLRREISEHGVDTDLVRTASGGRTGLFVKDPKPDGSRVYYYRSGSAAASMDAAYARDVIGCGARWVHLTGVTSALSTSCSELVGAVLDEARAAGVPVSYDVNYRPALWPDRSRAAQVTREAADRATVVLVGLDEAADLWGVTTPEEVRALLATPTHVIVKDGAVEATTFHPSGRTTVPALPVDVVEPVGAGDAFAGGWLHGHLTGLSEAACLRLGHLMARVALSSHHDVGVLDEEVEALVERAVHGTDWPRAVTTDPSDATPTLPRSTHAPL